ncbi:MAG: helix-turn-helix transcriptional regulator [Granulosicoccaceae bacterium]
MKTQTRQDDLVRLLRRRGSTTVAYLSASMEVSRRTVLRDIAVLREQGFDIRTSSGPGGGIYLDPSSILVTAKLTSSEAFALLISIAVLKETHALPFAHLADAGLHKIEQSLPRDRILELRKILASVYIGRPSVDMPPLDEKGLDDSVLPAFETGFLNTQRIQFSYTDRLGRKTLRAADPHAMLVLSPYWYLVGFDPHKEAFRHFRMDRISDASVLEDSFRRRSFTLEEGQCPFSSFSWN